tara:strand:- start:13 stop:453 length:441 start_codon:yes stop_codon:yes gene_type:complete
MSRNKRISKEIEKLTYDYLRTENDKLEVIFNDYLLYFVFPEYYPFKPPKMYIKKENCIKKEYINSFMIFRKKNEKFIKEKIKSSWCPCCNTVICNWSPGNTINDIISEFEKYEDIKKNIINSYLICRANIFIENIEDNIISFLNTY